MNGNGSVSPTHEGLSSENYNYLKCWFTLIHHGKEVFNTIFNWGFQKPNSEIKPSLFENPKYTNSRYRSDFDGTQRLKIEQNDVDSFDITILYLLLQRICSLPGPQDPNWGRNGDPDTLPNILYRIKSLRNTLAHTNVEINQQTMMDELNKLKELFGKAYMKAGDAFNISIGETEKIKDILSSKIEAVRNAGSSIADQLKKVAKEKATFAREEARCELKDHYETISKVVLAPWTTIEALKNVEDIFTEPILKQHKNEILYRQLTEKESLVDLSDILISKLSDDSLPNIILLLSRSGMGKTTLVKFIMHAWKETSIKLKGIEEVDLILYLDCRTSRCSSFENVLSSLMPNTARIFGVSELKLYVLSMRVLVILDNIDEIKEESILVCEEMMNFQNFRVLATSTQNMSRFFNQSHHQKHLKLHVQGISVDKINSWVSKLHDASIAGSNQNSNSDIVSSFCSQYLTKCSYFTSQSVHSPEILTHLFFNWMVQQKECPVPSYATETEIFLTTHELMMGKLFDKISHFGIQTNLIESKIIYANLNKLFSKIFKIAFEMLLQGTYEMPIHLFEQLVEESKNLELTASLILKEFLYIQEGNKYGRIITRITFPSVSFQLFYAAIYVANVLLRDEAPTSVSTLLGEVFFQTISNNNIITFFKYMLGYLVQKDKRIFEKNMPDTLSIINKNCTDVTTSQTWIDIVAETHCNFAAMNLTSQLMGNNWSLEDHGISSSFLTMLKNFPPKNLSLTTCVSPTNIVCFTNALQICASTNLSLCLHLYYNFWVEKNVYCDDFLQIIARSNSKLESFAGKLSFRGILKVPSSVKRLALHIGPEDVTILNNSLSRMDNLIMLYLNFDISIFYPSSGVPMLKLPRNDIILYVDLWNIDKSILGWSCDVLSSLSPAYCRITLRKTNLNFEMVQTWLNIFRNCRIHSDAITISSFNSISDTEIKTLKDLAQSFECLDFNWIHL